MHPSSPGVQQWNLQHSASLNLAALHIYATNAGQGLNHELSCFMVFFQHHWIQYLLGKERTGTGIEGWMGEIYVWQSCVGIEGYSITCFWQRSITNIEMCLSWLQHRHSFIRLRVEMEARKSLWTSGACRCSQCGHVCMKFSLSAAIFSRSLVLFCCNLLSLSTGVSAAILSLHRYFSFTSSLSSTPDMILLLPLYQSFTPLFRSLCSTSSSVSFVSTSLPIFMLLCWFESFSRVRAQR